MATSPDVSCKADRRQATNGTSDVPRCKGRPWVYRHTAGRLFMGNESDGGSIPSNFAPATLIGQGRLCSGLTTRPNIGYEQSQQLDS